jgi:hypothetical protein
MYEAPGQGDAQVYFEVLSNAGRLTLTVTADPGRCRCDPRRLRRDHGPETGAQAAASLAKRRSPRSGSE